MSFARVALPLLFFAAATAGCAMDDGGAASGSSSGGELTPDFRGECEALFGCGCEHYIFADVDACVAVFEAEWAGVKARAAAAGLIADSNCFQSTRPFASYGCKSDAELIAALPECSFCQHAHGSKGAGEPCTAYDERTSDCAQGLRCFPGTDPICEDPCGAAGEGQSCERIPCAEELFCDEDTRICMARGDLGDTCTNNLECEAGSHCGGEISSICVELAGLGEPCDLPCAEGLDCNFETLICVPRSGLGEPCDLILCAEDLSCDPESNTCVPMSGLGEPCDLIPCTEDLFCIPESNTCVPMSAPGELCNLVPCAEDSYCNSETGVCEPKSGLGEPCGDIDCAAGSFCAEKGPVCIESAGLGEPCGNTNCADGLACDFESYVCTPLRGLGEPCTSWASCTEGLLCESGTCARLPAEGEPCFFNVWDEFGQCAVGHICANPFEDPTCVRLPPLVCAGYY